MPTIKELREFIKSASKNSDCPMPSLSGNKAELLTKAKKMGYSSGADDKAAKAHAKAAELTKLKKQSDRIKAIRKRQAKTTKTPGVIAIKPTKEQQAVIDTKKNIKTVWKGKQLKNKVVPRKKPAVTPMWGSKSNEIRKNLAQTDRYWG